MGELDAFRIFRRLPRIARIAQHSAEWELRTRGRLDLGTLECEGSVGLEPQPTSATQAQELAPRDSAVRANAVASPVEGGFAWGRQPAVRHMTGLALFAYLNDLNGFNGARFDARLRKVRPCASFARDQAERRGHRAFNNQV